MRNVFLFLAALLAFGIAWYYYQSVSEQTATIRKLRLVAEDGLMIEAGTVVDEEFLQRYVVSQVMPRALEGEFTWALDDSQATIVNLTGRTFGQDVAGGSFLQRAHFFVAPENAFARRIRTGYRAFSIPVDRNRAVENFISPGAHVDVIGTFEADDGTITSRRLLENVEVMAVGKVDSRGEFETLDRPDYDSVTLQAPAEAVDTYLAQAENVTGPLTLLLRNPCEAATDCEGGAEAGQ